MGRKKRTSACSRPEGKKNLRVLKAGDDNCFRMRDGPERTVPVRMDPTAPFTVDFDAPVTFSGGVYSEHVSENDE